MLEVDNSALLDCEQICIGTYSPLKGMMGKDQLNSVLDNMRLENDHIWSLPVLIQKKKKGIYGNASSEEVKELKNEGIETEILPWIDNKEN